MTCAYLGPAGSNSHSAAKLAFGTAKPLLPLPSLSEVFDFLQQGGDSVAVVPMENVLQGPVTETLDLLVTYAGRVWIERALVLPIKNALGILDEGKTHSASLQNISVVYSHAQPLFQCRNYLDTHVAKAQRVALSSTSAACEKVALEKLSDAAVIAPPETLKQYGFTVLEDDISQLTDNKTRFLVIRAGDNFAGPFHRGRLQPKGDHAQANFVTSLAINPKKDRQGILLEVLEIVSKGHGLNLLSIHSRPDSHGGFIFHIDIEGSTEDQSVIDCLAALEDYCHTVTDSTAELMVFGSYIGQSFREPSFRKVAIVGSDGEMGCWFGRFFEEVGFEVIGIEKSSPNVATLIKDADIILFSVPMSAFDAAMRSVAPALVSGQLVVENCSLKGQRLDTLVQHCPPGVEILGIHTMFAGDRHNVRGENIVVTRTAKSGEKAEMFLNLFYKFGARIVDASAGEHDKRMALLQSLVQLLALTFAETARRKDVSLEQLAPFTSSNSRRMLEIASRVLSQSEQLIVDLQQENTLSQNVRIRFLEVFFELCAAFENQDLKSFERLIRDCRAFHKIGPRRDG